AINAGNNALIPPGVTTDQRGAARIGFNAVDVGAFESNFDTPPIETPSLVVTTAEDDVVNKIDGLTSLREAIAYANTLPGANEITFDPTVFATHRTIPLIGGPLAMIDAATTTIVPPAAGVTISGNNASRVFFIDTSASAALSGLTITGGSAEQ